MKDEMEMQWAYTWWVVINGIVCGGSFQRSRMYRGSCGSRYIHDSGEALGGYPGQELSFFFHFPSTVRGMRNRA